VRASSRCRSHPSARRGSKCVRLVLLHELLEFGKVERGLQLLPLAKVMRCGETSIGCTRKEEVRTSSIHSTEYELQHICRSSYAFTRPPTAAHTMHQVHTLCTHYAYTLCTYTLHALRTHAMHTHSHSLTHSLTHTITCVHTPTSHTNISLSLST
jgi:hypothetical protein